MSVFESRTAARADRHAPVESLAPCLLNTISEAGTGRPAGDLWNAAFAAALGTQPRSLWPSDSDLSALHVMIRCYVPGYSYDPDQYPVPTV